MKDKIKIKVIDGSKVVTWTVDAEIFGPIAVHESVGEHAWVITHIKSGWTFGNNFTEKRAAIAVAKKLNRRPDLFANLSKTDGKKNAEAAAYYRECRDEVKSARWSTF